MPWFSGLPQLLGSLASKPGARVSSLPPTPPPSPVRETKFSSTKLGVQRWFFNFRCQVGRIVFNSHLCDTFDEDLTSWREFMSVNGDNAKSHPREYYRPDTERSDQGLLSKRAAGPVVRFGYLLPLKRPGHTQQMGLYRIHAIILPFILIHTRASCGMTYLSTAVIEGSDPRTNKQSDHHLDRQIPQVGDLVRGTYNESRESLE
ncbi:uncharacterized protein BJX67DRAFT_187399 [Aspergillus lucknowensis]|uniref:Uncharacterized protein n=1 Tax=Aspergillus lucknowensis TaxID=176173 RepID=A0ABR4LNY2_9EURO